MIVKVVLGVVASLRLLDMLTTMAQGDLSANSGGKLYRVTILECNNLLLFSVWCFWQLVCHYCSYLLPRENGRTFQI